MLKDMERKLVSGGALLQEKEAEQLQAKRQYQKQLKEQRKKERKLREEKQRQDDELLSAAQQFQSMEEELKATRALMER